MNFSMEVRKFIYSVCDSIKYGYLHKPFDFGTVSYFIIKIRKRMRLGYGSSNNQSGVKGLRNFYKNVTLLG